MTRPMAGRMRDRVTIREAGSSDAPSGQPVLSWANTTTISPAVQWAEVIQGSGTESTRSDAQMTDSPYTVTFGYIGELTTKYRLLLEDSSILEIGSVTHDQMRTHTVCLCTRTT